MNRQNINNIKMGDTKKQDNKMLDTKIKDKKMEDIKMQEKKMEDTKMQDEKMEDIKVREIKFVEVGKKVYNLQPQAGSVKISDLTPGLKFMPDDLKDHMFNFFEVVDSNNVIIEVEEDIQPDLWNLPLNYMLFFYILSELVKKRNVEKGDVELLKCTHDYSHIKYLIKVQCTTVQEACEKYIDTFYELESPLYKVLKGLDKLFKKNFPTLYSTIKRRYFFPD